MIKNITFQGLSTTPSSHECQDGEIAAMLNLVPEDGALKPLHNPYKIAELEGGAQLWVHETPDYLHYIKRLEDGTWWWSSDINAEEWTQIVGKENHINGKVLVVESSTQMTADSLQEYMTKGGAYTEIAIYTNNSSLSKDLALTDKYCYLLCKDCTKMKDDTDEDIAFTVTYNDEEYSVYEIAKEFGNALMYTVDVQPEIEYTAQAKYSDKLITDSSVYTDSSLVDDVGHSGESTDGGTNTLYCNEKNKYLYLFCTECTYNANTSGYPKVAEISASGKPTVYVINICSRTETEMFGGRNIINGTNVNDVAYNGNVLTIAMDDEPIQYVIWSADDNDYRYLGQIPKVDIDFKLEGDMEIVSAAGAIYVGEESSGTEGDQGDYNEFMFTKRASSDVAKFIWVNTKQGDSGYGYNDETDYNSALCLTSEYLASKMSIGTSYYFANGSAKKIRLCVITSEGAKYATNIKVLVPKEKKVKYNGYYYDCPICPEITAGSGVYVKYTNDIKFILIGCEDGDAQIPVTVYKKSGYMGLYSTASDSNYYVANTSENLMNILGVCTKFDKYVSEEKNNFTHPFLVRYGISLYDGSIVYTSSPKLMIPNWGANPTIMLTGYSGEITEYSSVQAIGYGCALYYKISEIGNMHLWRNIIDNIVICISKPITWVNGSTEYERMISKIPTYSPKSDNVFPYGLFGTSKHALADGIAELFDIEISEDLCSAIIYPPTYTKKEFISQLNTAASGFYRLEQIKSKDVKITDWIKADTSKLNIMYPETGIEVKYDSLAKNMLYANKLRAYNGRQHLVNVKEQLNTDGCAISQVIPVSERKQWYRLKVETKKNGQQHVMWTMPREGNAEYVMYFFSEDSDVFQLTIYRYLEEYTTTISNNATGETASHHDSAEYYKAVIKVTTHEVIDGAYAYESDNFTWETTTEDEYSTEQTEIPIVPHQNEIYVSEVNNPFVYPSANAVQCGRGAVNNVGVNTETISEGQFGEAPLYAFTDEETWVLSLADSGVYQTKQVLTDSICLNPDNVVALPNGVCFTTVNGIMIAAGKGLQCISDNLRDLVSRYTLPHLGAIMEARTLENKSDYLPRYTFDGDWLEFLKNCKMAYDKVNSRIIVSPDSSDISFVYSMRSGLWGMQGISISGTIEKAGKSWILQDYEDMQVISDLSNSEDCTDVGYTFNDIDNCYLITRPMGIEDPDIMKRVHSMIIRGNFRKGGIACGLYGSRDLFTWRLIHTSVDHYLRGMSGTPYKYFMAVLVGGLKEDESVQGLSIDYDNLMTNQMR